MKNCDLGIVYEKPEPTLSIFRSYNHNERSRDKTKENDYISHFNESTGKQTSKKKKKDYSLKN